MGKPSSAAAGHLLRVLGIAFGLSVVVGGVVGQGILRTPGIVAGAVPDPTLILLLWLVGGIAVLIDACSLVELAASVPLEGGPYALARRTYGSTAGTVVGWADWVNSALIIAFLSVVFGEYCQRLGIGANWPIAVLSLSLIAACTAINWTGTRSSGASQTAFSALKGAALVAFVLALFLISPHDSHTPAAALSPMRSVLAAAALVAMSAVFNTYFGWNSSIYFSEEIVAPERNIVRATFGGILLVIALYLAVNAALLHVLSPAEMGASKLPAGDAARRVFGPRGDTLVTVLSLLSVGAITNLYMMVSSRVGFAMARDGILPAQFARTSGSGTPRLALAAGALVAAAAAASGTYEQIVSATVALSLCIATSINLAAIVMRWKEPGLERPFKMPGYPLPSLIGMMINLSLLAGLLFEDPWHSAIGIAAALALGAAYSAFGSRRPAATV
jgi:APA family basic amino acid/polyamine antiporter